jgi:hypothetical protein
VGVSDKKISSTLSVELRDGVIDPLSQAGLNNDKKLNFKKS